jgi:hypothetical protein
MFSSYLEFQRMDKVHKAIDAEDFFLQSFGKRNLSDKVDINFEYNLNPVN